MQDIKFIFLISFFCLIFSCKKEEEAPPNPYDAIDRSENKPNIAEPDPNSIAGLHKNIFSPKCAPPGCHDGTFEPDYRTIESTFSTLVYQPVNKATVDDSLTVFSQRVIPYNTTESFLIERLTTPTSDFMPSNSTRLTTAEIDHVKTWINAGCPDNNGALPQKPDLPPNIIGYFAVDLSNLTRLDTIRVNNFPLNPFIVPVNRTMNIAILASDAADGPYATPVDSFTVKEIHFSTDMNNFSGATIISTIIHYDPFDAWIITVPGNIWPAGTTVYFRIYVNDGHHPGMNTEFPQDDSFEFYKTLYAFYVQ